MAQRLGCTLILIVGALAGCAVPSPTVRQGLDFGFRTPEQTFRSWRTAVQGELLVEEYKTLSKGWRARNGGVSLQTYAEAHDRVLEQYPHLRWGLYRAKEPEIVARGEKVVLLQSRIPGPLWFRDRWLAVRLVREGFWELFMEDDPFNSEFGNFNLDIIDNFVLRYDAVKRPGHLYADLPIPPEAADWPADVTLMRVGWEWKIDEFQLLDAPLGEQDALPGP